MRFIAARLAQRMRGPRRRSAGAHARPGCALECREDRGRHGAADGDWYAADGAAAWSHDARREIDWDTPPPLGDAPCCRLYAGNYLNYLNVAPVTTGADFASVLGSRLATALPSAAALEVTLLRLSNDGGSGDAAAEGGMVVSAWAAADSGAAASAAAAALAAPDGAAAIAEATVEALRVASGADVDFGLASQAAPGTPAPSVAESREAADATRYRDPYAHACRPMSIAVLAAGPPDAGADAGAAAHAAAPLLASAAATTACPRWPRDSARRTCGWTCRTRSDRSSCSRARPPARRATPRSRTSPARAGSMPVDPTCCTSCSRRRCSTMPRRSCPRTTSRHPRRCRRWRCAGCTATSSATTSRRPATACPRTTPRSQRCGTRRRARSATTTTSRRLLFTQSGRLHVVDSATGTEVWSFVPAPLLSDPRSPGDATPDARRDGGIAAEPRLHRFDANGDGLIRRDDGDHVWLLFGLAATPVFYALDLTDADAPRLLWRRGADELPGLVDSRTRVAIARLEVARARQASGHWVVALTSGADTLLDGPVAQADRSTPRLYLLEGASGALLWQAAGATGLDADLVIAGFVNGLRAPPRLLDLDGDGELDRAYAVDVVGRIWRLDFFPGAERGGLARARLFATLGASDAAASDAGALRFHQEPDVARVAGGGARSWLAVSLGSGNSARPRGLDAPDRFYSLRDPAVAPVDATTAATIHEADLVDVTDGATVDPAARGWLIRLDAHGPGEKTAAPSITVDHRLLVTTWQPRATDAARPCRPPAGVARLYDLALGDGRPRHVVREAEEEPDDDPSRELADPLWPGRTRIALPGDVACEATACGSGANVVVGSEVLPLSLDFSPRRVTWRELAIDAASR
ncbi:MAG: PilC/PilY family type IV pilus protein [Steroidobacteraceae bacterium]